MIKRTEAQAGLFRRRAEERISRVLTNHGVMHGAFVTDERNPDVRYTAFARSDGEYEIVILEDITMTHGKQLFECYLTREFESDDALIDSFAGRLDRFLRGGVWEESDER